MMVILFIAQRQTRNSQQLILHLKIPFFFR